MSIEIQLVDEEHQAYIRALLDEYLKELAEYGEVNHSYPYFDAYWSDRDSRWPYFILEDGEVVGFAFVNTISPSGRGTDFSMAEFYIRPSARGSGCGLAAAKAVFLKHLGVWELSIMRANKPAQTFWPKAISATDTVERQVFEHEAQTIHCFSTKPVA